MRCVLVTEFEPAEQLTSEYRQDLRALLEAKLQGHEPVTGFSEHILWVALIGGRCGRRIAAGRRPRCDGEQPRRERQETQ